MSARPCASCENVPEHFSSGCTCTTAGESPECAHHGYEAVIRRLNAEVERLREQLGYAIDAIEGRPWTGWNTDIAKDELG